MKKSVILVLCLNLLCCSSNKLSLNNSKNEKLNNLIKNALPFNINYYFNQDNKVTVCILSEPESKYINSAYNILYKKLRNFTFTRNDSLFSAETKYTQINQKELQKLRLHSDLIIVYLSDIDSASAKSRAILFDYKKNEVVYSKNYVYSGGGYFQKILMGACLILLFISIVSLTTMGPTTA